MRLVPAVVAAIGLAFTSSTHAQLPGHSQSGPPVHFSTVGSIGIWSLEAARQSGRRAGCRAHAQYEPGVWLHLFVSRDYQWGMGVTSTEFNLQGATVVLRFAVDDADADTVFADTPKRNHARIALPPGSELFKRLMRGKVLRVSTVDRTYSFDLRDTSKVLPQLVACVRDGLNPESLESHAPSRFPAGGDPDLRGEIASLAANLLSEAGVTGFRIKPSSDSKNTISWTAPNGTGMLMVVLEQGVKRPTDMTPRLISIAAEKCKGKFVSGAMPEEDGAARVFSSCQVGANEPNTGYYLTIRRPAGGHYVIITFPKVAASTPAPSEPDKHIRDAAYRVLK